MTGVLRNAGQNSSSSSGIPMDLAPPCLEAADEKQVQLGLPGAWAADSGEASDHYTTKIGGRPDWPPSLQQHSLLRDDLLKCAVCGGWLGLVAQVYAPLALPHGQQLSDRTIFILGCPAPGCGATPACWRTIRVQKDPTTVTDAGEGNCASLETIATETESCAVEPSGDWWEEESSWGGETLDTGTTAIPHSEEFLNMNELAASLMEAGRLAAEGPNEETRSTRGSAVKPTREKISSNGTYTGAQNQTLLALPVFPCFYVYFQGEAISLEKAKSRPSPSPPPPPPPPSSSSSPPVEESGDTVAEVWEGEEYEPDRALHADRTYLRFKKHLDLSPEQCFRYCFGGHVLWALEDKEVRSAAQGKCGACGGPRVYEMQLMPPLLYFLQRATKRVSAPVLLSLDEWDWFTLAVFTCAQSCSQKTGGHGGGGDADWCIVEEAAVLQQEATRICASDLSM